MSRTRKFIAETRVRRDHGCYDLSVGDAEKPMQEPFVRCVMAQNVDDGANPVVDPAQTNEADLLDGFGGALPMDDPVDFLVSAAPERDALDQTATGDLLAPSASDPLDELFAPPMKAVSAQVGGYGVRGDGGSNDEGMTGAGEVDALLAASEEDPLEALLAETEADEGSDLLAESDIDPLDILLGGPEKET